MKICFTDQPCKRNQATVEFTPAATQTKQTNINLPMNMNAFFNTDPVSEAFAPAETSPFNAPRTETATSITRTIGSACERTAGRFAAGLLQGIGWTMAALYFIGATALGVLVLCHTFVR
jgi:hypothetical protein